VTVAESPDPAHPEVVVVKTRRVACDGVGGALGHPLVWLEMGDQDFVECGYCDRRFVLAGSGSRAASQTPGVYESGDGH
jgi:uncharacterized Zn-finger protein